MKEVAIIGIACKFPQADNYRQFWKNLAEQKSGITEVPEFRWDWKEYWGDPKVEPNKSFSKWAGFINDVDAFDADFFGLLPKVVESMDPQQRIMLELTWKCIEDAGIAPSSLGGKNIGVIFGVFNHDYKELQESGDLNLEAHHSTGSAASIIANRISHYFDFKGPSFPVDSACSSSLSSIHNAIQALETDGCELAISGGVNLILTPTRHISFSKMGMLSPTGSCKTFDDSADGYVRGEGAGVVLLKPLDKAMEDGDSIYGVIKSTAINHCGETYTLTYPSPDGQASVIMDAIRRAGVDINNISYIESHGTGTPKGDPVEIEGLEKAFSKLAKEQSVDLQEAKCALGALKTNIGHLEAAAGVAGLIKILLAFKHRELPALQNFKKLNNRINLDNLPFYVLDKKEKWVTPTLTSGEKAPMLAGISSFGFGGTNAHLIAQEPPKGKDLVTFLSLLF